MTTRVKVQITEAHNPVEVRALDPKTGQPGAEAHVLTEAGDSVELFVHSASALTVTEVQPA